VRRVKTYSLHNKNIDQIKNVYLLYIKEENKNNQTGTNIT